MRPPWCDLLARRRNEKTKRNLLWQAGNSPRPPTTSSDRNQVLPQRSWGDSSKFQVSWILVERFQDVWGRKSPFSVTLAGCLNACTVQAVIMLLHCDSRIYRYQQCLQFFLCFSSDCLEHYNSGNTKVCNIAGMHMTGKDAWNTKMSMVPYSEEANRCMLLWYNYSDNNGIEVLTNHLSVIMLVVYVNLVSLTGDIK